MNVCFEKRSKVSSWSNELRRWRAFWRSYPDSRKERLNLFGKKEDEEIDWPERCELLANLVSILDLVPTPSFKSNQPSFSIRSSYSPSFGFIHSNKDWTCALAVSPSFWDSLCTSFIKFIQSGRAERVSGVGVIKAQQSSTQSYLKSKWTSRIVILILLLISSRWRIYLQTMMSCPISC